MEENKIIERASDDGEPNGTAGGPMLQLLSKQDLVNVLIVVTRYFGGILLGTGGLVRAYSGVANCGLEKAEVVNLALGEKLKVPVTYQNFAYLQYYCKKNNICIIHTNFDNEPYAIIEIQNNEKDKFICEMEEKGFDIEKIDLIDKAYLKKK